VEPITLAVDAPVQVGLRLMAEKRIGCVPILAAGELVGIVTRDLIAVAEEERLEVRVDAVMSHPVIVGHPNEDLFSLLQRMIHREVGHLAIVERESPGTLLGLLTRGDIGRAMHEDEHPPATPTADASSISGA